MANYAEARPNRQEPSPADRRMSALPTDCNGAAPAIPAAANQIVNDTPCPDSRRVSTRRRTRMSGIRFRFVLNAARRAVDGRRFGCGGARRAVAPIPQITSLHPSELWRGQGLQPAATRQTNACRPAACVSTSYPNFRKIRSRRKCPSSKALSIPGTTRLR